MRKLIQHYIMRAYLRYLLGQETRMPGTMWMFKSYIELTYEDHPLPDDQKKSAEEAAKNLRKIVKATGGF